MAICRENAIYETYHRNGITTPFENPAYFGSHLWTLRFTEWDYIQKPAIRHEHWWEHIVGPSTDIFDSYEKTGKIRQVWYCQYCREREVRLVDPPEDE
jgi:hypothetical protein